MINLCNRLKTQLELLFKANNVSAKSFQRLFINATIHDYYVKAKIIWQLFWLERFEAPENRYQNGQILNSTGRFELQKLSLEWQ